MICPILKYDLTVRSRRRPGRLLTLEEHAPSVSLNSHLNRRCSLSSRERGQIVYYLFKSMYRMSLSRHFNRYVLFPGPGSTWLLWVLKYLSWVHRGHIPQTHESNGGIVLMIVWVQGDIPLMILSKTCLCPSPQHHRDCWKIPFCLVDSHHGTSRPDLSGAWWNKTFLTPSGSYSWFPFLETRGEHILCSRPTMYQDSLSSLIGW